MGKEKVNANARPSDKNKTGKTPRTKGAALKKCALFWAPDLAPKGPRAGPHSEIMAKEGRSNNGLAGLGATSNRTQNC